MDANIRRNATRTKQYRIVDLLIVVLPLLMLCAAGGLSLSRPPAVGMNSDQ
jgi:hypothetical protein